MEDTTSSSDEKRIGLLAKFSGEECFTEKEDDFTFPDKPRLSFSRKGEVRKLSRGESVVDVSKSELQEKFRQTLSERQEIRRKNNYLQKKMVEFFRKRKMDHALKEDPKGLDLESKYLKKLFELQEQKKSTSGSRIVMLDSSAKLKEDFNHLQQELKTIENEFRDRQRKIATSVQLKSEKKISAKAVAHFLREQAQESELINRLHFLEIKEKRQLEVKQAAVKELESLGQGMSRAGFEFLNFQHQNLVQKLQEKEKKVTNAAEQEKRVRKQLYSAQIRLNDYEKTVLHQRERKEESEKEYIEVRMRVQKLKKAAMLLREDKKRLELNSKLLTQGDLLQDFETTRLAIEQRQKSLELHQRGRMSMGCRPVCNTPEPLDNMSGT